MKELRAIFFDVGNTLIYAHPSVSEVCRQVLAEAGHVRDLSVIDSYMPLLNAYYEDRYRADDTFWTSEEQTSEVWVGMYSMLCRRLDIHEDAAVLARAVYDQFERADRWRLYDDVRPAFERARGRGLRLGIISNWDSRLVRLMDALGISSLLDTVVSSADVGLRKPDPRIFELACARVGASPEESAHVGDHLYADVLGASAAGMRAVLIDRHGTHDEEGPAPIRTLDELESALGL